MEAEIERAEQATGNAREVYRHYKSPENKARYNAALQRERVARAALASKRKHRYKDKDKLDARKHDKGSTKEMFQTISSKGQKGDYKKGSKAEKKITDKATTSFKGVLQSDVAAGAVSQADSEKLTREFEKQFASIIAEIDQKAGLIDGFDKSKVDAMINERLAPILAKIPAFSGVASAEADIIGKSIQEYRSHRDDAYLYGELSKFQAGGGTIDNLVDRMYDDHDANK